MTRIALLGHGRWGKNIERTLAGMRTVRVHVSDPRESSPPPALDAIDAVVVATPGTTHANVALPFLERGIPTFIEKPLTTSLVDARRLERTARKHKTIVMVGHIHLYNPAYQATKSLLPTIGKIRHLHGEGLANGPYRDDMSVLWDWAPHDVSMMLDIVGRMPHSVQAWGLKLLRPKTKLHDTVFMKLRFPKSILGTIHVSWLSPEKRRKLTIVGTDSSIVFDDRAEKKVALFEGIGPKLSRGTSRTPASVTPRETRISYPSYAADLPLAIELAAFLEAVKTKRQPITPVAQGVQVVRVLEAAEQSVAGNGRSIQLRR